MKKMIFTSLLALLFAGWSTAQNRPEEYLGLPGDNLNLYAVMNIFQNSETLEGFEKSLNDPNTMINNLDLNGDNQVDYIMVLDYVEGNTHTIVLRVALNQYEHQDVAVFTVQKFNDGTAQVQLIGDEALYGRNYIIEPNYAETPNPGYRGNVVQQRPQTNTVVRTTYYEVATWPVIVYLSRPTYVVYRSRWHWGYQPVWWNPWRPHYWHYYYGYHYNWHSHYYSYYRPWRHHRSVTYHNHYYTNVRHTSNTVIVNVNKGNYNNTYSRPETRRDGEVLYTQRHSTGSTVPNRGNNTNNTQVRQSTRTTPDNQGVTRTDNTRRVSSTENATQRSGNVAVQNNEATRRQAEVGTSNPNSEVRRTVPQSNTSQRREAAATPAPTRDRSTPNQGVNTTERRTNAAPQRNTPQAERQVTPPAQRNQAAPAVRNETRANPSTNVQRSAPARNNNTTQSAPASVNRRNSNPPASVQRSAPASTPRQSAPSVRSSEPSSRSRNTGAAVQRSSSPSQRSTAAPQRSSSSESSTTRRGSRR